MNKDTNTKVMSLSAFSQTEIGPASPYSLDRGKVHLQDEDTAFLFEGLAHYLKGAQRAPGLL